MYESYWQLQQKPFENGADRRFYYPDESRQAALLKLRYAVENRRGGALLTGMSGLGKTLVASMLPEALGEDFSPFVHLVFPQMSTAELLAYLAGQLDGSKQGSQRADVSQSVQRIECLLAENSEAGRHAVVVVDEAHLIENAGTLEALRLLTNFESAGKPGLTLVLVGDTGLLPMLERMPQLDERLGVKCLIRPFTQQETTQYVAHRLKVAGARRTIFEPDALPALHTLTHGIPRKINRLCDLTLLIGFAEERRAINAANFESISKELVTVVPE